MFPYNIFTYCSICRVDCKFARNKKKKISDFLSSAPLISVSQYLQSPFCFHDYWRFQIIVAADTLIIYQRRPPPAVETWDVCLLKTTDEFVCNDIMVSTSYCGWDSDQTTFILVHWNRVLLETSTAPFLVNNISRFSLKHKVHSGVQKSSPIVPILNYMNSPLNFNFNIALNAHRILVEKP
jgi:hypothetical protein